MQDLFTTAAAGVPLAERMRPRTIDDVVGQPHLLGSGKPLRVVNDQVGTPTFTYDLADATLDLIDAEATGIYHVTNSGQTSWFDFARAIFEQFSLQPDLQPITSADWKQQRPQSATRPAWAVVSLGRGNRFGFPSPAVVARWRAAGARVLRTDEAGAVTVAIDAAGRLTVTTHDP